MIYSDIRAIPDAVKKLLPVDAQEVFRAAANSAAEEGLTENDAIGKAWERIRAGWQRPTSGLSKKWMKLPGVHRRDPARDITKDGPTTSDVHVPGIAGGPGKKKKPKALEGFSIDEVVPNEAAPVGKYWSDAAREAAAEARAAAAQHRKQSDSMMSRAEAARGVDKQSGMQYRTAAGFHASAAAAYDNAAAAHASGDESGAKQMTDSATTNANAASHFEAKHGLIKSDEAPTVSKSDIETVVGAAVRAGIEALGGVGKSEDVTASFQTGERLARIVKVDGELIWGWANVITEGGQPVTDVQGDQIEPGELVRFTTDFMVDHRVGKTNHEGDQTHVVVHSMPMTYELAKAFGIDTADEGWIVGVKPDADTLARAKSGDLAAFSIGGEGNRVPVGD